MRTLVIMVELPNSVTDERVEELIDEVIECHFKDNPYRGFDIGNVPLSGVTKVSLNVEFDTRL